jgi:NTP pyrophosphatase (non-canonical NTP hydrolase)
MNLEEYRIGRRRTMNADLDLRDQRLNAALGLGETGEVQNLVKKEIYHEHQADALGILDEVGDILFYADWLLETYGWTLEQAMIENIKKLQKRYPDGFDPERSINRKEE